NDIVGGKDANLASRTVLAETRIEDYCKGHGAEAAYGVDYRGSGEVDIAVAEIQRGSDLREPAAAPGPAAGDGIENRSDEEFTEQESPKGDALADRADDDVAGGLHEDDLEERQAVAAGIIGRADQEEAFAADESPLAAAD